MQIPAERLFAVLRPTLDRLLGPQDGFGSDHEAVRSALTLLHNRERSGAAMQRQWLERIAGEGEQLVRSLALPERAPDLAGRMAAIVAEARAVAAIDCLQTIEAAAMDLTPRIAELVGALAGDPRLERDARNRAIAAIVAWESGGILDAGAGRAIAEAKSAGEITRETLTRYLADRFGEPGIAVTELRPLPGGFGKQTILFSVAGQALAGDFVMRRDRDEPTLDNDCHRIVNEYPVIRAAFARGFRAPDALWLDTAHALLPGGDFIVMRRATGTPGGSVFSAANTISDELLNVLAQTLAGLHALPPLLELGDLTESINAETWSLSLNEATRRYVSGFREIYLREVAEVSPAIMALFGWMLDNLPDAPGRTVLCHGDVGFHNMLLEGGQLSALLDWEFAHVGDPAEDLAYVRNTAGTSLDWDRFLAAYRAAGGVEVDPARIRFFQAWGQLRNATASAVTFNCLVTGKHLDLKLAHTGFYHLPNFMAASAAVIAGQGD